MRPEETDHPLAGGFGTLTVTVKAKGKATVVGRLGDGTKVNVSGQLIAGEDGIFCLPVVATPYPRKKGGFSCNLWFKHGWLYNVTEIGMWKRVAKDAFEVAWWPVYTADSGSGVISDEMELLFDAPPETIGGLPLARDPEADSITPRGAMWKGTDVSGFSARLTARTGAFSGTMTFLGDKGGGTTKRTRANVYGVVVGGTGYGTVLVKNVGSWAVKVSACAACED